MKKIPNFTVISRGEIIAGMRLAKNAKAQKKIFAELCNCTIADIEQILKEDELMNRWTEKDIAVLYELIKEGKSRTEIAEHFGRDEKSVENKIYDLRRKGILQYPPKDKYTIQKPKKDPSKAAHTPHVSQPTQPDLQKVRNESDIAFFRVRCEALEKELVAKNAEILRLQKENASMLITLDIIERIVKS